ncbi:low specificity L-threonine aldolase [bacterium]|nr:low specificity L-threonine aldolase [candidate division CSSED10-310 bacterium]
MRRAMMDAPVGDDVFGEDPTVNLLQEEVADLLGKERALFVVSGTMANEIAVKVHTNPADGVILERNSHIFLYEGGGAAALAGVHLYPVLGRRGLMNSEQVREAITPEDDPHIPRTRLVCLENTHNRGGGSIHSIDEIRSIQKVALTHGMRMHLDGARLLNAAVASGIPACEYARFFDSVSICLSKGLGAPVGSVLTGSTHFIQEAIRVRKLFGGGWRQAGILAAAGRYALQHNVGRLADDHRNARLMADMLADLPGFELNPDEVETNIVIADVSGFPPGAHELVRAAAAGGVEFMAFSPVRIRLVANLGVTERDCRKAGEIIRKTVKRLLA